ncbi:uncharacterized protein LOC116417258 [Nasonia vitripennis]|uniref:Distal membrane-arm assembly complex protein 1-like domain-containing protein n=2 Tax=Pteromalinae TaxID=272242 RepID=A0A7M7QH33_NASVI|nr:uncharacterized protein LOC116417258 [Nasonia vitripennis]OXU20821.1 hypothetical protein TSAR_004006 [Trichomalopsis sarcophagae]
MDKLSEATSIVSNRDRECFSCRLVSGTGLVGAGLYIGYHSKNLQKTVGKTIMLCIAGTTFGLGVARILDLPPFRHQFEHKN